MGGFHLMIALLARRAGSNFDNIFVPTLVHFPGLGPRTSVETPTTPPVGRLRLLFRAALWLERARVSTR